MNSIVGLIGAAATVLVVVAGAGITWLAYAPRFKRQHEEEGMIPFLDSSLPAPESSGRTEKPRT